MESKLIAAVLCCLGLFVIVQALPSGPEDVEKYWKCTNYADCLSDGTVRQKLIKCIDNLKPEDNHHDVGPNFEELAPSSKTKKNPMNL
ncbi:hypothetical protein AVEN_147995-1 [Araneus ventricosus]|uniref:Uncharacterized protein n=1 Tax=Araneus ventricosus TaxID=182803 RepID=A0A4Y2H6X8_ARAVE|nr:hypothetical protein AVEN_147995-1 [Araneus ventricosus]